MRIVKIMCSYELYERICDILYTHIPFSIINDKYHAKRQWAFFYFWDSDYIPTALLPFVIQPPFDKESIDGIVNELKLGQEFLELIEELIPNVKTEK